MIEQVPRDVILDLRWSVPAAEIPRCNGRTGARTF
ncbi:hypothetical protein HDA40_007712 [Hamadaea flava]|nr:hypothetical protein [Hamadaea flava]